MILDMDTGTALTAVLALAGSWWTMAKLLINQFEKRQDERFKVLTETLSDHQNDLDEHMHKQDAFMGEIRRVEANTTNEIRRVEGEMARCRLDAVQQFQNKTEATLQHQEILAAIRLLGNRIDALHSADRAHMLNPAPPK